MVKIRFLIVRFQNPVVFTFSESGLFFSFSFFFRFVHFSKGSRAVTLYGTGSLLRKRDLHT